MKKIGNIDFKVVENEWDVYFDMALVMLDEIMKKIVGFSNPTIALGYVKPGGIIKIFSGDLSQIKVDLEINDKLILFSAH